MLSLLVGDVSPVLIFLFYFAATGIDVYRKLGELEDVRAKKADPVLDRILQRSNRGHDRDNRENADRDPNHR